MKHRNILKAAVGVTGLLALASPLSSAWALTVSSAGTVLMIDGTDAGVNVSFTAVDATFPISQYDFGFVSGGSYTSITTFANTYTFAGGTVVDFALRNRGTDGIFGTADDLIYSISNPLNYATQIFSFPIAASNSQNPVVPYTYYNALTLVWDLNKDGIADTGFDIAITALSGKDGLAPVPVPAAIWLLGSGVVGLLGLGARRRKSAATSA